MDFEVQRASRRCAGCQRELAEGEFFHSVLRSEGAQVRRDDYGSECWHGAPPGALGCWRSQIPHREAKKGRLAPNDVLLKFFQELEEQPHQADVLYVLALLLVRRRVFRLEETESVSGGAGTLVLYCPRDESTHRVREVLPSEVRVQEIQAQLEKLLFADAV